MKRSIKSLLGYTLSASDGEIGTVKEFFFDDETWTIRYMIVETGSWLFGKKVLISPQALLQPDWEAETFPVNLTMEQIKNSPDIDTEKPVSRQQEIELYNYYPWGSYWGGSLWSGGLGFGTTGMMMGGTLPLEEAVNRSVNTPGPKVEGDPHLRSTDEVQGYNILAIDGDIGNVEDFILDDNTWTIDFLKVDTGNWIPGKKVLLSPKWINKVDWATSSVVVNVPIDQVKNSPEYDSDAPLEDDYFTSLHHHYEKPVNN